MSITEGADCVIEKPSMATTGQTMNDGGPAFPKPCDGCSHAMNEHAQWGMSLRDWLAGMATDEDVAAVCLCEGMGTKNYRDRVKARYLHADAMLAERDKQETPDDDNG